MSEYEIRLGPARPGHFARRSHSPAAGRNGRFTALGPTGLNVLARVTDGTDTVPGETGPTRGRISVEFSVPSARTKRTRNPDNPLEWLEEPQQTPPVRYHRDSAYTFEYDPDTPKPFDAESSSR